MVRPLRSCCVGQKQIRTLSWISCPGVLTSVMLPKFAVFTNQFGVPRFGMVGCVENAEASA